MEDVKYALSLHYQGTPFDPYGKLGTEATRGLYRPIGINRNGQLSAVQLRPDVPEAVCAVQWIAYGSNPFNALVPLYANVDVAPEYFANTDDKVSTESFYWANRLIAGLADAHFGACAPDIERYQLKVGGEGHRVIGETDRRVRAEGLGYEAAAPVLAEANAAVAAFVREQTDDLLSKVLLTVSLAMKSGFSRSDG